MRLAAGLIGCVILAGCDGGSGGGRQLARPVDPRAPVAAQPEPERPAKSDDESVRLVEKAIAEHAGGPRAALAPLKTHVLKRTGKMFQRPTDGGDGRMVDAGMASQASWPDKYRTEFRTATYGERPYTMCLNGADGWHFNQAEGWPAARPFDPGMAPIMSSDVFAEWLLLMIPQIEATGTEYVPATAEPVNGKPTRAVQAWFTDRKPITLYFDEATSRLVQVKYQVLEFGGVVPKALTVVSHTRLGGVLVPEKVEYAANNRRFAEWATAEYELGKSFPAGTFDRP
jgi:hypothetical protein